jgi:adenine-specific DNA-methyltransferase
MAYNFAVTMPKLDWLTRPEDEKTAASVPYRLLDAVPELSYGDEHTENMLIQGDNLEALKSLLPFYAAQVKCIFIDPPYNTQSAFEQYDDNLEHTQWLGMMYPRLELLRELLTDDGSIWVSIDDNEAHYLKVIMDEIFGRASFIIDIAWKRRDGAPNDRKIGSTYDHILVYAKSRIGSAKKTRAEDAFNLMQRTEKADSQYQLYEEPFGFDERGPFRKVDSTGNAKGGRFVESLMYPVTNPFTGQTVVPRKGRCWVYKEEDMLQMVSERRFFWGKDGRAGTPMRKLFKSEAKSGMSAPSIWDDVGLNQHAAREIEILFGEKASFETPKPEGLMKRILEIASNRNDIVVDSFLGSGTTAAAAHKMGRRYIGIEMGGHASTHCVPRLTKVIDGEQGGISEDVLWKGGGGFRFYKLGSPVFDEHGRINPAIRFDQLAAHVWFSETRTPLLKRKRSPLLGIHEGTAYYLLYNGILGDKRPDGGNVLTRKVLAELPEHDGPRVIYGESSRLSPSSLEQLGIVFKQTPYDVKAR